MNILKRSIDLTLDTWIHGNKIIAVTDNKITEIRSITEPSFNACASHHKDHKNTWHTPL